MSETDVANSGKRVLIVDDDRYFRLALEASLKRHQHNITCAENAIHAQKLFELEEFDLVISDIRMPEMNGIELLGWIRAKHPSIPVILMTGFSEIIETQQAADLGARGFLAKPFKTEDLLAVIAACFTTEKACEDLDSQFSKIGIDDFISGKDMKYDIFIRLNARKYVKIAHSGENIEIERIKTYKEKKISFLFMRTEDFKKYLDFNLSLAKAVTKSDRIAQDKKINFVKHTTEIMLQNLYTNEIGEENFEQVKSIVENSVSLLGENTDAVNLLTALSNHTDFLYAHCVGVSFYSALIGKTLGWKSPSTVIRLSIGGLLHDVGKKEIPKEILNKPRETLSSDEITLLESHPVRGSRILSAMECIPTDILQIVHEHHEDCLGFGYPAHLTRSKIQPFARVVAVANDFCTMVIKNPDSPLRTPVEAILRLLTLNPRAYDANALQALAKVFNVQSPKGS